MNSNVVFQISTVVLALALAAVLIVVYVIPEDNSYVKPKINSGLIEVDEFDIVDSYSGSSTKGRILVINDGELRIRLMADIIVAEGDWSGFGASFSEGVVVDRICCEFNGDIEETESNGYCYFYNGTRGAEIIVDCEYHPYSTGKHKPGSGTLMVDLKMDPEKRDDDLDAVMCTIGIGSRTSEKGIRIIHPAYERFLLPVKDADREEAGGSYRQDGEVQRLRISDGIDPMTVVFRDPDLVLDLRPTISANDDGTFTFAPNLAIPAGQGKFRSLAMNFYVEPYGHSRTVSATFTDLESADPKAYAYGSQYYLTKGAKIESDRLEFTDSITFAFDGDLDKAQVGVFVIVGMSQDGRVNTFSKMIGFEISRSGIFYDTVDCRLTSQMEKSPTSEQMIDFKNLVESGDVVRITGDFTAISRFADLGVSFDTEGAFTAVVFDKSQGSLHSKTFYAGADLRIRLDAWAVSMLGGTSS